MASNSFVATNMKPILKPLADGQLQALQQLSAPLVANAIETFHERLRNEGFVSDTVHCLFPHLPPMVGYAATIKIRGSAPPTAGGIYPDRSDWWDYIMTVPAPRVVVVEDCAERPGLGSLLGGVHINILRALGCIGAVTNGAVRDIPTAEALRFPLFAGHVSVSHAYVHIVEIGRPIEIGGLKIQSGNLLHGDVHGVQMIPLDLAPRIPAVAREIADEEKKLIVLCQSPDFSLDKLRAAVKQVRH
jgi:regulator of RNase E activity RraA